MKVIKISIIDDHSVVRSGLSALINSWNGMRVVNEFESGEDFIESIQLEHHSDVVILDYQLKGMSGIDTLNELIRLGISLPVILLTVSDTSVFNESKEHLNLFSAESKNINLEILKQRINQAAGSSKKSNSVPIDHLIEKISPREMEFIRLICNDKEYTYQEIAHIMAVHIRTVDSFRKSLFSKLNIKSKTGLVMFAIKNKLV